MNHMKVVVVIMRRLDSLVPFLQQRQGIPCLEGIGRREIRNLGQTWNERLKYVSTPTKDDKDLTVVSVRSDGFVAWPSESEPNLTAAAKSIERWVRQCDVRRNTNSI